MPAPCIVALRCLELLASRALALAVGFHPWAGARLLSRIVLPWRGRGALPARLLARRLTLARLGGDALTLALALGLFTLRWARLRLRPVRRFASGRGLGTARFLVALRALFAAFAFALLRQRGQRRHEGHAKYERGVQDASGGGLIHRWIPADTPPAQEPVLTRWR